MRAQGPFEVPVVINGERVSIYIYEDASWWEKE